MPGVRTYESDALDTAGKICGCMVFASVFLCHSFLCLFFLCKTLSPAERNKKSFKMAWSDIGRNDTVLYLPDDTILSGRAADELLLWKSGVSGICIIEKSHLTKVVF